MGGYATKTPKNRVQCMCALCDEADATNGAAAPGPGKVTHNCYTKEAWSAEKQDWCCANKQLGCPPKTKTRRDETPKDETSKDKTPPKDETPENETSKDETPKDETPKDETPKYEAPENDTPENDTPEIETPKIETPETKTPQDETPKSDAAGNNSKAGSCSCMGYNADGSIVPSGECGW